MPMANSESSIPETGNYFEVLLPVEAMHGLKEGLRDNTARPARRALLPLGMMTLFVRDPIPELFEGETELRDSKGHLAEGNGINQLMDLLRDQITSCFVSTRGAVEGNTIAVRAHGKCRTSMSSRNVVKYFGKCLAGLVGVNGKTLVLYTCLYFFIGHLLNVIASEMIHHTIEQCVLWVGLCVEVPVLYERLPNNAALLCVRLFRAIECAGIDGGGVRERIVNFWNHPQTQEAYVAA